MDSSRPIHSGHNEGLHHMLVHYLGWVWIYSSTHP